MSAKTLTGLAVGVAMGLGAATAEATVSEPGEASWLLPASPGLVVGLGSLVTTVGTAVALEGGEVHVGWASTAIVFGSLSLISGGIYTGLAYRDDHNPPRGIFTATAATDFVLGVSSLALGIVNASMDPLPIAPMMSIDAGGSPFASVIGSF